MQELSSDIPVKSEINSTKRRKYNRSISRKYSRKYCKNKNIALQLHDNCNIYKQNMKIK